MALDDDRFATEANRSAEPTFEPEGEDDRDAGRSNFAAFLLGGVVVSAGLLGFLYFDIDDSTRRDGLTVGDMPAIAQPLGAPPAAPGPASVPALPR